MKKLINNSFFTFENFSHVYRDNCGFFWSVTNPHNSFYANYYVSKSPVIAFFLLAQLGHFKQCTGHIDMLNVGLLTMDNRQGTVRFVASLRYVRTYTNTDLTLPFMYSTSVTVNPHTCRHIGSI